MSDPPDFNCPDDGSGTSGTTTVATTAACTKCDGNRANNVWVERGPNPGDEDRIGICLLDTMSEAQVIYSVQRNDRARADLLRVTTDPRLLEIARTVPRLTTVELSDEEQRDMNRANTAASIPFYAIFQGRLPGG